MKKSKIIFFSIMLLTLLISFTIAQEIQSTKGIETSQVVENDVVKSTTYTFTEAEDSLSIGGHNYWNIQPSSDTNSAFIKVNDKNEITDASFKVNEKGGQYAFGNQLVTLPANSSVFLRKGVLIIDQPLGTNISYIENASFGSIGNGPSKIIYSGDDLILPSGDKLNKGSIEYIHSSFYLGNSLHPSDEIVINSVHFSNIKSPIPVYFGGDGTKEGVSFNGSSTIINLKSRDYLSYALSQAWKENTPIIQFDLGNNNNFLVAPQEQFYFTFQKATNSISYANTYGHGLLHINRKDYIIRYGDFYSTSLINDYWTSNTNNAVLQLSIYPVHVKNPEGGDTILFDASGFAIENLRKINSDKAVDDFIWLQQSGQLGF